MILLSSGSSATGGSPIYSTLPLVISLQFFLPTLHVSHHFDD